MKYCVKYLNYSIIELRYSYIKSCKLIVFCVYIFIFAKIHSSVSAQNLYDYEHTLKYGKYLFESKQYKLAAEELERALFFTPTSDSLKFQLVKSYLLGNEYDIVLKRVDSLFPNKAAMPGKIAFDYTKALISKDYYDQAMQIANASLTLKPQEKAFLRMNKNLLTYRWVEAENDFKMLNQQDGKSLQEYNNLFVRIHHTSYKNRWLALALSAVLPGSGKVYTGDWKDGLISFLFVGGTTIQAIRGYNKYGQNSGFFIIYGSIATSFYLGNLYGSFKSANKHNEKLRKQIQAEARRIYNGAL